MKENFGERLSKVAYEMAMTPYHGQVMGLDSNLEPIVTHFPPWALENWDNRWCAAFVYHCVVNTGVNLPMHFKHTEIPCNFAGCIAWECYAKIQEKKAYFLPTDEGFVPRAGDIVLYDGVYENKPHDHIGIVIENHLLDLKVAEGNVGNISSVVMRKKNKQIRAYLRFEFDVV